MMLTQADLSTKRNLKTFFAGLFCLIRCALSAIWILRLRRPSLIRRLTYYVNPFTTWA
jgi:hypothetical protein